MNIRMSACLTPLHRAEMAQCVAGDKLTQAIEAEGPDAMTDRSSRPARLNFPPRHQDTQAF